MFEMKEFHRVIKVTIFIHIQTIWNPLFKHQFSWHNYQL